MKLWELRATTPAPDTVIAMIVRAESAGGARMLAREEHGGEGSFVWLDVTRTTCVELTPAGNAGVVMANFSAE